MINDFGYKSSGFPCARTISNKLIELSYYPMKVAKCRNSVERLWGVLGNLSYLRPLTCPCKILSALFLSLILLSSVSEKALGADSSSKKQIFARINQRTIFYDEFARIFHAAVRYKYYHGKVPQKELVNFQRQVGKDIVEQVLLYQQALKLGLVPDNEKIQAGLAEYDKKYSGEREWQRQKEKNLSLLLDRLERQDLVEQMQLKIKTIARPDLDSVKEFYKQHPEKFTEPKRVWLSVILLAVPPSSSEKVWIDAKKAAGQFIQKINQGEDFAAIARQYSAHPSAVDGGDLGYLHQGMLEGDAKQVVESIKKGKLSQPVRLLEGIAVFRVNGAQTEKLKVFNEVKNRATGLLYRELQNEAWDKYLKKLNQSADVYINVKLYASIDEKKSIK